MNTKRVFLGLAAAAAFGLVAAELISLASLSIGPVLQSVVLSLFGTAVGGFIARKGFVLPALGLWFVEWLAVFYVLYRVAAGTGQASVMTIAQLNLLNVVLSAVAVALGALLGQALAARTWKAASAI